MIRTLTVFALLLCTYSAWEAHGQTSAMKVPQDKLRLGSREKLLGVGVQVGTLSGLSFEYWNSRTTTLNTSLTVTRGNTAAGFTHVWMIPEAFEGSWRAVVPFVGAGFLGMWANSSRDPGNQIYRNDHFAVSLQVPIGVQYLPLAERYSVFAEVVPSYEVAPAQVGFVNADIGVRLYF